MRCNPTSPWYVLVFHSTNRFAYGFACSCFLNSIQVKCLRGLGTYLGALYPRQTVLFAISPARPRPATWQCISTKKLPPGVSFLFLTGFKFPKVLVGTINEPLDFKTRTHNMRVGSAQRRADGGPGRPWAEQSADISVALEANSPSGPPAHCKNLSWTSPRKHEQRNLYVNGWKNKTSG